MPFEGAARPPPSTSASAASLVPAARLRAWRSVAMRALRCLLLACESAALRLALLDCGAPLLLLRLCAARGTATSLLEHSRMAKLASRILGMLAGVAPPFASSSAASFAVAAASTSAAAARPKLSGSASAAALATASECRALLGALLAGGLDSRLASPRRFLKVSSPHLPLHLPTPSPRHLTTSPRHLPASPLHLPASR